MSVRLDYDIDAEALYVSLSDEQVVRTVEIDSVTMVDLDASDRLVGIEVLTFHRPWPLSEILARYGLPSEDADQLRAVFGADDQPRVEVPALSLTQPELIAS